MVTMRLIVAQDSDSPASEDPHSDEESTWDGLGVRERTTGSGGGSGGGSGPGGDIEDQRVFALVRSRLFATAGQLRVGHYRIERQLGAGAMGEVHLAVDEELERPVAIKFVRAQLTGAAANKQLWAERLRAEARALARLAHPNVVRVYEVGEYDERVYLAMEFIEGGSLREWLRDASASWEQVLTAYLDAGRGLAAAHAAGLVHRDFKPDNVLRGRDGRVAVADFGLASVDPEHVLAASTTAVDGRLDRPSPLPTSGVLRGTPSYMAPEQFGGWADARSDQFAFCVALFEALWGRRPFAQFTLDEALHGEVEWKPVPPPSNSPVPGWVWSLLRRGLAREPEDRWPDLDALLSAIEARLHARRRRAWLVGSAFSAVLVGLLSAAAVGWWGHDPAPDACEALDAELDETWTATQRSALLDRFVALPYLSGSEVPVLAGLDRWRVAWLDARTQLCRARVGGDVVVLDRQAACLERQRRATQALVDAMLTGDEASVRAGPGAIERLADPAACSVEARLGGPLPAPAAIADAVERVRDEHAIVEAELLLARGERALGRLTGLDEQVRQLDHAPLQAEHELLRGQALLFIDPERGFAALEHAADIGEGTRHDALVADSWRIMASAAATKLPDLERGRRWLRRADAAATRVGIDELGAARLELVRADLELLDNQHQAALDLLEPLLPLFEARDQQLLAAETAKAIGTALLGRGDLQAAVRMFDRALGHAEAVYGPRHPDLGIAAYNLGQVTLDAGLLDESRGLLERAVEIWSSSDASTARERGRAHLVLGQLALVEGHNHDVLAHGRAAAQAFERSPTVGDIEYTEAAALTGVALYYLGEFDEATLALHRAVEGYTAAYGADDAATSRYRLSLAWSLLGEGQHDEAAQAFEQALTTLQAKAADDAANIFDARLGLIAVALAAERPEQAARELAALDRGALGELERMEVALLDGLAQRRSGGDPAVIATSFTEAATLAPTLANGRVILDLLLISVHASADERRLATPS